MLPDGYGLKEVVGDKGYHSNTSHQRRSTGRRISFIGVLHGHANSARLQIDRMLGFAGEMRAAVLHPRDLGVGVVRMRPVVVRAFFRFRCPRREAWPADLFGVESPAQVVARIDRVDPRIQRFSNRRAQGSVSGT